MKVVFFNLLPLPAAYVLLRFLSLVPLNISVAALGGGSAYFWQPVIFISNVLALH